MKRLFFLRSKKLSLIAFMILSLSAEIIYAKTCLSFNIEAHKENLHSPIEVKEFLFSKSTQMSEPDSKLLFLDYSDNGDILTKHAFITCNEIMTKYYKCVAEEYKLSIDLSQKEPILYFTSLMISDYEEPVQEIKSKQNSHVKIIGIKKTCPTPDRELKVIEG